MRRVCVGFVVALILSAVFVSAQTPLPGSAVPTKPPTPALDEREQLMVQIGALSRQLAQCHEQQLDSVKQALTLQDEVKKRIDAAHGPGTPGCPTGCTLDVTSWTLKPVEKK